MPSNFRLPSERAARRRAVVTVVLAAALGAAITAGAVISHCAALAVAC